MDPRDRFDLDENTHDTLPAPPPSFTPNPLNADKTYDEFDGFAIPLDHSDFDSD